MHGACDAADEDRDFLFFGMFWIRSPGAASCCDSRGGGVAVFKRLEKTIRD